jgi:hypothetical protein
MKKNCIQSSNAAGLQCEQCGAVPDTIHAPLFKKGKFCVGCCGCASGVKQSAPPRSAPTKRAPVKRTPAKQVPVKEQQPTRPAETQDRRDPFYRDDRRESGPWIPKRDWFRK